MSYTFLKEENYGYAQEKRKRKKRWHEKENGMNGGMKNGKMQKKTNGLTPAQKKLPPALQAAILKKKKGK